MAEWGYIHDEIEVSPDALYDEMAAEMQVYQPGWEPAAGDLTTRIFLVLAGFIAQAVAVATDVPPSVLRYLGRLHDIPPIDATVATSTVTITAVDDTGYTLAQGAEILFDGVAFATTADATIAPGDTTATLVPVAAVTAGVEGNDITGTGQIVVPSVAWVASIELEDPTAGGVDAETDDDYLDRLSDELRIVSPTPILTDEWAVMARRIPPIARTTAIDRYVPAVNEVQRLTPTGVTAGTFTLTYSGQTTAGINWNATPGAIQSALEALSNIDPGDVAVTGGPINSTAVDVEFTGTLAGTNVAQMTVNNASLTGTVAVSTVTAGVPADNNVDLAVTVAVADEDGEDVGPVVRAACLAYLETLRATNWLVDVIAPTYTTINVTVETAGWPGATVDDATRNTQVEEALEVYLSPGSWGSPPEAPPAQWVIDDKVRYLEVAQAVNAVPAVRHITALTVNGGTSDVSLTGPAPLPRAGTITATAA